MEIRNVYPIQPIQAKNNSIAKISNETKNTTQSINNQVSFKGWPNILKPAMQRVVKHDKETLYFLEETASILGTDAEKLKKLAQGKTRIQFDFLNAMAERFNATNFGRPKEEREKADVVLDLFKRITKPQKEHVGFVKRVKMTMTDIKKCFDFCEDDPKKINKLESVYDQISGSKLNDDILAQIIESPNAQEYIENVEKYAPQIKFERDTKGIIRKLDEKLMTGENVDSLNRQQKITEILESLPASRELTPERFAPHYSDEGIHLMRTVKIKLQPTGESLDKGDAKGLLKIYNSTTKKNAEFREKFLEANYYNFGQRDQVGKNEVNEIAGLFELADKDPKTRTFLEKMADRNASIGNAGTYLKLIEQVGSERLEKDINFLIKTANSGKYNPNETLLKHYKEGTESTAQKILSSIKSLFGGKAAEPTPVRDLITVDSMSATAKVRKPYIKPMITIKPAEAPEIIKTETTKPIITTPVITETTETKPARKSHIFKPVVPKQPSAKKLAVINDVNNVIEKKLGSKVLEEQSSIYANKATKMRLGMLPEIFESIKDTRAAARANGTFSRTKTESNALAVDLYSRINGKNKKLVNYMLKARAEDGTRRFTIRDILDTLKDANKEIIQGKSNSTKEHRFTAKDERAIYDRMFEEKVAQYGALKRAKASKKA